MEMIGLTSEFGAQTIQLPDTPVHVFGDQSKFLGCESYSRQDANLVKDKVLLISRGKCEFYKKALFAQEAGAVGVIFLSNEPHLFRPSFLKNDIRIPCVLLSQTDSLVLIQQQTKRMYLTMDTLFLTPDSQFEMLLKRERVHNAILV